MRRLSAATSTEVQGVDVPDYDRSQPPAIVHIGVGAFARAHLGVYADDLLQAGHASSIRGISLRTPRSEEQLAPQDGLYTVTVREPTTAPTTRLIGSITSVATGAVAAVDAIAQPTTKLVTLTVTEKGYELDDPRSAPAVLVEALAARRRATDEPVVIASLDNLLDNGAVLRSAVLESADRIDPDLRDWIAQSARFPCSVVDRMVPSTSSADRADVADRLGVVDDAAVVAEAHRSWVLERCDGLLPLDQLGVEVVSDITTSQRRKLWLLNGPHSVLAYCGLLAGHATIADAAQDPIVAGFVRGFVDDVLEVVPPDAGSSATFAATSLRRFANVSLGHACSQVAVDGSRKLAQRLLPVMDRRADEGRDRARFHVVVAAWLAAVAGTSVGGREMARVADPAAGIVEDVLRARGPEAAIIAAFGEQAIGRHAGSIAASYHRLVQGGVRALAETA